ncbi:MAG: cyclase family protein [Rhodospirillaceae bacterium]|jgi:kynurenine formamidase|nr:cyclase family protein [Rhodospirillaceae bacterium]MBT5297678.1 cyclase family protein [Rhodospirillaceae bacterium]MBT5512506.1 cyclase family protein [Rhodospirillaceae bacterium]MBT6086399.1 cyclase family protein [Rhodospirillaceae bacterium]MBT6609576.1 cyclase family protein [Rhodospirillaceae bacterium]
MTKRWMNRPDGSTWGDWGEDDQRGRMNLVTPERRVQAAREVKDGLSFCLSMPLDLPGGNAVNPKRLPPQFGPVFHPPGAKDFYYNYDWNAVVEGNMDITSDECVTIYSQYSTQWDSFAHVGSRFDADGDGEAEIVYYNGYRGGEHIKGPDDPDGMGARALGVENMAASGMQGRGVVVDFHRHFGDERVAVNYDLLMDVFKKDDVVVEEGDFFLFHTGWDNMLFEMAGDPDAKKLHSSGAVLDGFDDRMLQWITDSGVVALISDNMAVEAPDGYGESHGGCTRLPIHRHCLFRLGVHLGEIWHLAELATALQERGRSRCLLTAPPLRMPGAVGSPATPVATI